MTPLDKTLKRVLNIKGDDFVVTLTPDTLKLTRKGHQRGVEMRWESLVSGEAALAVALQASVGKFAAHRTDAGSTATPAAQTASQHKSTARAPTKRPSPVKRSKKTSAKSKSR